MNNNKREKNIYIKDGEDHILTICLSMLLGIRYYEVIAACYQLVWV